MAHPEVEEYQQYFSRLRPVYPLMFNLAHAIVGNCDQAEYCVQYALVDCWAMGHAFTSHHGFREDLRSTVIRTARKTAATSEAREAEFDWDGLAWDGASDHPILRQIAQEPLETRRMLALHYGCGLPPRHIAPLCRTDARRVQLLLRRFEARIRHRVAPAERRRCEGLIARAIRGLMAQPCAGMPELAKVFRNFQADAESISRPSRLPVRLVHGALALLLGLFCIVAFWLAAVLLQPAVLEEASPSAPSVEATSTAP